MKAFASLCLPDMRGSRKFCQRRFNSDNVDVGREDPNTLCQCFAGGPMMAQK